MAEAKPRTRTTTRTRTRRPSKTAARTLISFNPRTGENVREIPASSPAEVADAVSHARKVQPEWAAIPIEGRVRMLRQIRYRIYEKQDEIVATVAQECGKPEIEALAHDVMPPQIMLAYFERVASKALRPERVGTLIGPLLGYKSRIEWRPFGVVGAITPWNYPLTNSFLAFLGALFAGNAVVIKPSEVTPASGELLRDLLDPLPPGVATIVQGGGDVGAALVDAPCDKISFVGSPVTGRKICEAAAKHLTPVVMELGGKDAAIVCGDADVDIASSGILWSSFFNAGQTCCSIERVYVVDDVADAFTEQLIDKAGRIQQGEEVGSLTFGRQLEIVTRQVSDAIQKGARVLAGGPEAGLKNKNGSLWYAPTILTDVTGEMSVLSEETFGPVVNVVRVRDEDEAVRRANEDGVNLTASIWSPRRETVERVAARLKSGSITANLHGETVGTAWGTWGGVGESGFGRLNGIQGLREFAQPVHVASSPTPRMKRATWYPYDDPTEEVFRSIVKFLGSPGAADKLSAVRGIVTNYMKAIRNKI